MQIDPKVEAPTRTLLDQAMRGELGEVSGTLDSLDAEQRQRSVELCLMITGYVVIDVCGNRWPDEAAMRRFAQNAVRAETRLALDEDEVYAYVSRSVLDQEPVSQVFTDPARSLVAPILLTASILLTCRPREKDVWTWLDEIEAATEAAATMESYLYPAAIYRARISG